MYQIIHMPRKKGFTPDKYQEEVLQLLTKYPFMSTSEICDKLGMGYETSLKYLNKLHSKNRIKLRKIGSTQIWFQ